MIALLIFEVLVYCAYSGAAQTCTAKSSLMKWTSLVKGHTRQCPYVYSFREGIPESLTLESVFPIEISPSDSESVSIDDLPSHCDAITFSDYIDHLMRKENDKTSPTTWVDKSYLFKFTDYNELNGKARKINCAPRANSSADATVLIVNSTVLLERLGHKNESAKKSQYCAVVMFYAPWCPFCARMAPEYNAIARAFPHLDVYAIDAVNFSKFGTVAVPNILIFHQAKAVARFNSSERSFEKLKSFVKNVTGLSPNNSVEVSADDYMGPLSNEPSNDPDYFLWFSWAFVIIFTCTCFAQSATAKGLWAIIERHMGHLEGQHIE